MTDRIFPAKLKYLYLIGSIFYLSLRLLTLSSFAEIVAYDNYHQASYWQMWGRPNFNWILSPLCTPPQALRTKKPGNSASITGRVKLIHLVEHRCQFQMSPWQAQFTTAAKTIWGVAGLMEGPVSAGKHGYQKPVIKNYLWFFEF